MYFAISFFKIKKFYNRNDINSNVFFYNSDLHVQNKILRNTIYSFINKEKNSNLYFKKINRDELK